MDNVTHAIAGLLLAEATVTLAERTAKRPLAPTFRRAALVVGVVAAELPDIDLLYAGPLLGMGKLGYLLHHRGHTHTLVFAVLGALLLWGATLAFRKDLRQKTESRWLLATALAGTTLTHLALDWTNNYGVHPWWPVDNRWYYGDAIFIIEPWLWVAMIPPLLLLERSRVVRALLVVAMLGVLVLAWRMPMVGDGVALVLTVGAPLALAIAWRLKSRDKRIAFALGAFVMVEALFGAASSAAKSEVRAATGATLEEAAITPAVANPFCFNALVVEHEAATYRVSSATIAPFGHIRAMSTCRVPEALVNRGARPSSRASTASVRWGQEWSAPVAELQALARENCELAAALRFIRVPVWERTADGRVRLADLRYERGSGGGFAEVVSSGPPARCPGAVPPWVPPRKALLR